MDTTIAQIDAQQAALTGDMTVKAFIEWMDSLGCFQGASQHMGYWPASLRWETVRGLVEIGLLRVDIGGPNAYGGRTYYRVLA